MKRLLIYLVGFSLFVSSCSGVKQLHRSEKDLIKARENRYAEWDARIFLTSGDTIYHGNNFRLRQDSTSLVQVGTDSLITLPNNRISHVRLYEDLPLRPGQAIGGLVMLAGILTLVRPEEECTGSTVACGFSHDVKTGAGSILLITGLMWGLTSTVIPKYHEIIY